MKELKKFIRKVLSEAFIDSKGELKGWEGKVFYPYDRIKPFIDWFQGKYGNYAAKQGWAIFDSDYEQPNHKYHSERIFNDKLLTGYYWQVQRLDSPGEDEALSGELENDNKAYDLAKKLGLMVDEYGVVYGWKGQSFLDE